jgi:predicted RNase H-like HicB family nuclease
MPSHGFDAITGRLLIVAFTERVRGTVRIINARQTTRREAHDYHFCPEFPGCQRQGDTLDEVTANIREAVDLYLETLSSIEFLKPDCIPSQALWETRDDP